MRYRLLLRTLTSKSWPSRCALAGDSGATRLVFVFVCARWVRRRAWVISVVTAAGLDGVLEADSDRRSRAAAARRTGTAAAARLGVSLDRPVAARLPSRLTRRRRTCSGRQFVPLPGDGELELAVGRQRRERGNLEFVVRWLHL